MGQSPLRSLATEKDWLPFVGESPQHQVKPAPHRSSNGVGANASGAGSKNHGDITPFRVPPPSATQPRPQALAIGAPVAGGVIALSGGGSVDMVMITATDPNAAEQGLKTGTFTITRTNSLGDYSAPLTVSYGASGGYAGAATMGDDYETFPGYSGSGGTIFFNSGAPGIAQTATLTVTPKPDTTPEVDETVNVYLKIAGGYEVINPSSATVTIADDDIAFANVAITSPINEGSTATLSGDLTDFHPNANPILVVNWGDGSVTQTVGLNGTTHFSVPHVYADDNPSGTPSDLYPISLTLSDDRGGNAIAGTAITVNNVAPTATVANYLTQADRPVTVTVTGLSDPGIPSGTETFTYAFDWNNDGDFADPGEAPGPSPSRSHTFTLADVGVRSVPIQVTDDDTGQANLTSLITVYALQSVQWVASTSPGFVSPLTPNSGPGGGLSITPDKDVPNDFNDRSWVNVSATLTSPLVGIPINLQVIDVDDPSANTKPVDNESNGWDNRDTVLPYPVQIRSTNGAGSVQFSFQVSMHPGDNYRVVASLDPITNGRFGAIQNDGTSARVQDNSNGGTPVPYAGPQVSMASDMLTVWRRLHVEMDTMGTVDHNYVDGTMTVRTVLRATAIVDMDQTLDPAEAGRFLPGTLLDSAGNTFTVVSHTTGANFSVTVNLLPGGIAPVAGHFLLRDDDSLATGARLSDPDTSTLTSALADAYVVPVNDVGIHDINVPFVLNAGDTEQAIDPILQSFWQSRGSNADNFWVAYLLGAFQGPIGRDGDPDPEFTALPGAILGETSSHGGSLIFQEAITDYARSIGIAASVKAADNVVHEIGHALGKLNAEPVTGFYDSPRVPSKYKPDYLNAIRSVLKPWG